MSIHVEPPAVLPPLTAKSTASNETLERAVSTSESWIERAIGGESYGAPRVFDLFTLMAITVAFALLFAFLRLIEPILLIDISGVALCLGTFVTGIAIFQIALFGGHRPRLASLIGGPFLVIGFLLAFEIWRGRGEVANFTLAANYGRCLFALFFGGPAGYAAGALVAGVFMIADMLRTHLFGSNRAPPAENDDQIFADER